ncbi:MAG: NAD-dependent epimerase/dehydratase family protein [Desulfurococcales archaeon]|nr:NAD-dependent epimerase/dehydratase family protein [Desulfurococcales archaeon]
MGGVVVTGAAGFIGSYLVDALASRRGFEEIIGVDNLSSGSLDNLRSHLGRGYFRFIRGDLKDPRGGWVDGFRDAGVVFHFAANPEVRLSSESPKASFWDNVVASFNVLEAARRFGVEWIVYASTSTVYGDAGVIPTPEDYHPLRPISVYGASKLAVENLIHSYCSLYGIRGLIVRYANVVGPRSNHGVIVDFIRKLRENPRVLEILGDGSQRKSYLYVGDAVDATLHLFDYVRDRNGVFEVFNVGSSDWITVREIADIVVGEMGLEGVEYRFRPATSDGRGWPGDVKFMLLDVPRLLSTGWRPRYDSAGAVRLTVRGLLQSYDR